MWMIGLALSSAPVIWLLPHASHQYHQVSASD
jgi:hypothetical protein